MARLRAAPAPADHLLVAAPVVPCPDPVERDGRPVGRAMARARNAIWRVREGYHSHDHAPGDADDQRSASARPVPGHTGTAPATSLSESCACLTHEFGDVESWSGKQKELRIMDTW